MEVMLKAEKLDKLLKLVARAVPTKTSLPILNTIQLTAKEGVLAAAANNLEMTITSDVSAEVKQEGQICLPAKFLTDFVSRLPGSDLVTLSVLNETFTLTLVCGKIHTNMKGYNAEDFPDIIGSTTGSYVQLKAQDFKLALDTTTFAASGDETRPVLTGILMEFDEDNLTTAAADSFRLATRQVVVGRSDSKFSVVVPARAMVELSRILPDDEKSDVEIQATGNRNMLLIRFGSTRFTVNVIEGNFPNYKNIIPKDSDTLAQVNLKQLMNAIQIADVLASSSAHIIKLEVLSAQQAVVLSVVSQEMGDHRQELNAKVSGNDTNIAFNAQYVMEILKAPWPKGTEQIELRLNTSSQPGLFQAPNLSRIQHVVMPMHLAPTGAAPATTGKEKPLKASAAADPIAKKKGKPAAKPEARDEADVPEGEEESEAEAGELETADAS
jgi:DNA polymerase-3 subunit beta